MRFVVELTLDTELEVLAENEDRAIEKALKEIANKIAKDECDALEVSAYADEDGYSGCDIKTI